MDATDPSPTARTVIHRAVHCLETNRTPPTAKLVAWRLGLEILVGITNNRMTRHVIKLNLVFKPTQRLFHEDEL